MARATRFAVSPWPAFKRGRVKGRTGLKAVSREAAQVAPVVDVPAPVGGWNTAEARGLMSPTDAVQLDNWYPGLGNVSIRAGTASHATNVGNASADVDSLMTYEGKGTSQMLAAAGGFLYNVTQAATASAIGSSFTNDRWDHVNMNDRMVLVNGAAAPQVYKGFGAGVSAMTVSASAGNIDESTFVGCHVHESRVYYWADNDTDIWYTSTAGGFGGLLKKFPLGDVGSWGGKLVGMTTWMVEGGTTNWAGGSAAIDLAVFVLSSGHVIMYQGDDPGSNWSLVGNFKIGHLISIRGIVTVGGDVMLVTSQGYLSLAAVVAGKGRIDRQSFVSEKIQEAAISAFDNFEANTPWDSIYFEAGNRIMINVPTTGSAAVQHVMNLTTRAWCRFTGINARAWATLNKELYYAGNDGTVYKAETGNTDLSASGAIVADARTAFSDLGLPGVLKNIPAIKPIIASRAQVNLGFAAQFDFQEAPPAVVRVSFGSAPFRWENWDDANWEDQNENNWEGNPIATLTGWLAAAGAGYEVGMRLQASAIEPVQWHSTSYKVQPGSGLV